jgi:hypothetical protein
LPVTGAKGGTRFSGHERLWFLHRHTMAKMADSQATPVEPEMEVQAAETGTDEGLSFVQSHPVSVSIKYWMAGDPEGGCPAESRRWDSSNVADARVGLPSGIPPLKVRAHSSPLQF